MNVIFGTVTDDKCVYKFFMKNQYLLTSRPVNMETVILIDTLF